MRQISIVASVLFLSSDVLSSTAFSPTASFVKETAVVFSSNDDDLESNEYEKMYSTEERTQNNSNIDEEQQKLAKTTSSPIDFSTTNRPLLGEVAVDGSLVVLAPAVAIGITGLIFSVVIAFNSGDEFVQTGTRIDNGIVDQTLLQPNMDTCTGICKQDQDGLKNFMQSLRK